MSFIIDSTTFKNPALFDEQEVDVQTAIHRTLANNIINIDASWPTVERVIIVFEGVCDDDADSMLSILESNIASPLNITDHFSESYTALIISDKIDHTINRLNKHRIGFSYVKVGS